MKKIIIISFLVIVLFTFSQVAFGFTFRGIEIGKSLDQQMTKCPPHSFPYKAMCWLEISSQPKNNLYDIQGLTSLGGFDGIVKVTTIDGKIEYIEMLFADFIASKFLELLEAKYGKSKNRKNC